MATVEFVQEKTKLTANLIGEIDHHGAWQVRDIIDAQILKLMPRVVVMNFSKVTFMDSSGIGLVLARFKFCQDCGTSLYVEGINPQTGKILSLAGIKTIQDISI